MMNNKYFRLAQTLSREAVMYSNKNKWAQAMKPLRRSK